MIAKSRSRSATTPTSTRPRCDSIPAGRSCAARSTSGRRASEQPQPSATEAEDDGETYRTAAADAELGVHLTRDETQASHGALRPILLGAYAIPASEFHTRMGLMPDEARLALDALGESLSRPGSG